MRALIIADVLLGSAYDGDRHHGHFRGWCQETLERPSDFEQVMLAIREVVPEDCFYLEISLKTQQNLQTADALSYRLLERTLLRRGSIRGFTEMWPDDDFRDLTQLVLTNPKGRTTLEDYCMHVRGGQPYGDFEESLLEALMGIEDFTPRVEEYINFWRSRVRRRYA